MHTSLSNLDPSRNYDAEAIAARCESNRRALFAELDRQTRLASYRPGPHVPLASLREDLSEISDTRGFIFEQMAQGYTPPPGAFDDLNLREDAIVAEIQVRECVEDLQLRVAPRRHATSEGRRWTD